MNTFDKNKDWLLQHAKLTPDSFAVITSSQKITFADFNKLVLNAVNVLTDAGIKKNDHCAVISNNNIEFIVSILSLWRIGGVPVPLNIRLTNNELNEQIKFTGCGFIILHKDLKDNFDFKDRKVITVPFVSPHLKNISDFESSFKNDRISLLLFTSGSTDKPKAVVFTFKNFISSAVQTTKMINAGENDSWLASLPFYHIGGFMILVRALINGNTLIVPDSLSQNDILKAMGKFSPSVISFVPTQLSGIINEGIEPYKNLKAVFLGGGPSENDLIISAKEKGWPVIKVYGSTETCSMITALDLRENIYKIMSAGKALGGNLISVKGKNKKGELVIESASVAKCYYKDPGNKLLNGKFYSNDFGFIDDEGYLFIEGRVDDIIISGGENIDTKEITIALLKNDNIIDAFTFAINDEKWGQSPASAVVLKDKNITEENLKKYLKSKIAAYKIPKKIFFVEFIPKTDLGKVRKEELLKSLNLY